MEAVTNPEGETMLRDEEDVKVKYWTSEWDDIHALQIPLDVVADVVRRMERSRAFAMVLARTARNKGQWEDVANSLDPLIRLFMGRIVAHFNANNYSATYIYAIDQIRVFVESAHDVSRMRYRPRFQGIVDDFIHATNGWHDIIRYGGYIYVSDGTTPNQPPLPQEYSEPETVPDTDDTSLIPEVQVPDGIPLTQETQYTGDDEIPQPSPETMEEETIQPRRRRRGV